MAAPSSVYKDHKTRVPLGDAQGGVASFRDLFVAKFLQNTTPDAGDGYFNAADIPPTAADHTAAINKIKQIFKLDLLIAIHTPDGAGFIGAVLEGSTNSLYHKSTRFSGVPIPKGVSGGTVQHILLNDAGLNTLGDVDINSVLGSDSQTKDDQPANYPPRINNTVVYITFKSAFYVSTSAMALLMKNENDNNYTTVQSFGTLAQRQVLAVKSAVVDAITKSGEHIFKALITNDEGTIETATVAVDIKMGLTTFKYNATIASYALESGVDRARYHNTKEMLDAATYADHATQLFKDETSTPEHTEDGFYVLGDMWYQYGFDTVEGRYCIMKKEKAEAGSFPQGDPGNVVVDENLVYFNGFDAFDQSAADTEVNSGNYDQGSIYLYRELDFNTNPMTETYVAYTDASKQAFAQQGYYAFGEMVFGVERRIEIGGNGVVVYDSQYV